MPCEFYRSADGKLAYVLCSHGQRKVTPCHYCGKPSTSLCDYPLENGKTCDKPMCNNCQNHIGPDLDVCHEHNNFNDIAITLGGDKNHIPQP